MSAVVKTSLSGLRPPKQQSRSKLGPKVGPEGNPKNRSKVGQRCGIGKSYILTYF